MTLLVLNSVKCYSLFDEQQVNKLIQSLEKIIKDFTHTEIREYNNWGSIYKTVVHVPTFSGIIDNKCGASLDKNTKIQKMSPNKRLKVLIKKMIFMLDKKELDLAV